MLWAPCDEPEEPQPLRLLRHKSDEHTSQAECLVSDPTRRCFAFHWPAFLGRDTAQAHRRKGHVMRSTCWFARGGCTCDYTYGVLALEPSVANCDSSAVRCNPLSPGSQQCPRQLDSEIIFGELCGEHGEAHRADLHTTGSKAESERLAQLGEPELLRGRHAICRLALGRREPIPGKGAGLLHRLVVLGRTAGVLDCTQGGGHGALAGEHCGSGPPAWRSTKHGRHDAKAHRALPDAGAATAGRFLASTDQHYLAVDSESPAWLSPARGALQLPPVPGTPRARGGQRRDAAAKSGDMV
ncbi:unnamed protein product, partial [Symbiodinium sp. CCMP2456]